MVLTKNEKELIDAIRNFRNSRHNYSMWLEEYVRECFEILLDKDDSEED